VVREDRNLRISAVVCTYSNASLLRRTLDSLVKQTLPPQEYEIIVVDNNSTDNTREVVHGFQKRGSHQIHYVLETTQGLSAARNTGIQHSSGPIISFIDDDAEADPNWLAAVVEAFSQNPDAWAVGGNTFAIWDAKRPAWLKDDFLSDLSIQDRGPDKLKLTVGENILGANCSFRREVFVEIGYFPTDLGRVGKSLLAGEEAELCQRIHLQGKGMYHIPDVVVFHHVTPERMTRSYLNRRLYFSGISRAFWLARVYGVAFASHDLQEWLLRFALGVLSDGRRFLTLKRPNHTLFRHWTWFRFCAGYARGLRHVRTLEPGQDSHRPAHNLPAKEAASTSISPMNSRRRSPYRRLVDFLTTRYPTISTLGRLGRWALITLKNTPLGIGCIGLVVVVGLYIAGALVEPLRWYLIGTASGLSLLWGGLLALSYSRLWLDRITTEQTEQLSDLRSDIGDLKRFAGEWAPKLGLDLDARELAHIADHILLAEDTCIGRLSGDIETMLLRVLVAHSVKEPNLEVLEIGTMFGVGVATIHEYCRGFFGNVHITVIDPLNGYYGKAQPRPLDRIPITRDIFVGNMKRMNVPETDYTIIEKLSSEDEAIEQASRRRYSLLVIDGNHSYSGVKRDFSNYRQLVKRDGYIIFDDYGNPDWPGLTDFIDKEVAGMPELKLIGVDVNIAVFKVIAPYEPIKKFDSRERKQVTRRRMSG